MSDVAWFAPGFAIALVVSIAASDRLGHALGTRQIIAWAIVMGFGGVLAATLTPVSGPAVQDGHSLSCDLSRIGLATPDQFFTVKDIRGNLLLLVPLGAALGLVRRSRGWLILLALAFALPFAVEGIQALVSPLNRACESGDMIDNLTGLVVGLGLGALVGRLTHGRLVR
jgi:hypothetical protein